MTLTSRGQDRHRVRNLPVHLLQRIGSAVDLVKDLAVLDKEHSSRVGRRPDAVGHHKDRLPFLIDPVKKLQKLSGSPGVQSTRRYCVVSKNDSFVQFCFSLAPIGARSGLCKRQIAQKRGPNRELLPARSSFTFSSYFFR